jgi:hypothetical protein
MVYMIAQNVRPLAKCETIGKCEKISLMPLRHTYFKVAALASKIDVPLQSLTHFQLEK